MNLDSRVHPSLGSLHAMGFNYRLASGFLEAERVEAYWAILSEQCTVNSLGPEQNIGKCPHPSICIHLFVYCSFITDFTVQLVLITATLPAEPGPRCFPAD